MTIEKNLKILVDIDSKEIAKLFCKMNSDQQVLFFNEVAKLVKEWNEPFCFQMQGIIDSDILLSYEVKDIIKTMAEYID